MPAVNIDELNEIMDNDPELIQECFADFLVDYPGLITALKSAVSSQKFEEIDNTAHKIKGILKYLAAGAAATAAQRLEVAGRNQDSQGLQDKLDALEAECARVIRFIDEFSP